MYREEILLAVVANFTTALSHLITTVEVKQSPNVVIEAIFSGTCSENLRKLI